MMRANVSGILGAVSGHPAEFHLAKHPYFLDVFGEPPVDHLPDGDSPYRGMMLKKWKQRRRVGTMHYARNVYSLVAELP